MSTQESLTRTVGLSPLGMNLQTVVAGLRGVCGWNPDHLAPFFKGFVVDKQPLFQ